MPPAGETGSLAHHMGHAALSFVIAGFLAVTTNAQAVKSSFRPGAMYTAKEGIKAQLDAVWALSVQMKVANAAGLIYNSSDGVRFEETRKQLWSMMVRRNAPMRGSRERWGLRVPTCTNAFDP